MDAAFAFLTAGTGLSAWTFFGLCGVSFLGSFLAASLGLGGGILTIAAMAAVLPPVVLVPLHGIVQLGSNSFRALLLIRHVLFPVVPAFAVGTVLGSAVGASTLVALPGWVLQAILGVFILYATWAPKFRAEKPGALKFLAAGSASGFATMFIGGSGPMVAPFVSAASAQRQQVVSTHAFLMSIQHSVKVVAFSTIGFQFGPYVPLLAGLLLFGFCGTYIGKQLLNRLPEKVFRSTLNAILTLLGLRLLYAAWRGAMS